MRTSGAAAEGHRPEDTVDDYTDDEGLSTELPRAMAPRSHTGHTSTQAGPRSAEIAAPWYSPPHRSHRGPGA